MISNAKLEKLQQLPKRESITHRFKETNFWDYVEGKGWKIECSGYHYFDLILRKNINKPFSYIIFKCRTHPSYNHCKGFKRQVESEIKHLMKRPQASWFPYPNRPSLEGEFFLDMEGIVREIKDHPDYFIFPDKERVLWRDWRDPTKISASHGKLIRKINGIHYFVAGFSETKYIYKTTQHGNKKKILNPHYSEIPLTKSQLQLYHLVNDREEV